MSMFKKLKSDSSIQTETDVIAGGGSKYGPWESGLYDVVIDMAYADQSQHGALNVNFVFKTADGRELKETIYVSNRAGDNTYKDKTTGEPRYLPGYTTVNSICLLTVGEELPDVELEEKVLNLWDNQQRKEIPQKKEVLMPLLGQQVTLGVVKVIEDKYNSPGETVTRNNTDKVFRAEDHLTTSEIRAGKVDAEFYDLWDKANTGKTRNKAKAAQPVETAAPSGSVKKLFG